MATPEDNAHIEALHSNLQREVIDRLEFESIFYAQMIVDQYYKMVIRKKKTRFAKSPSSGNGMEKI